MAKNKKLLGYNPKKLYIGKVGIQRTKVLFGDKNFDISENLLNSSYIKAVVPGNEKYVLLEKKKFRLSNSAKKYQEVGSNCYFGEFGICDSDYALVARIISPALPINYKGRLRYEDAQSLKEICTKKLSNNDK